MIKEKKENSEIGPADISETFGSLKRKVSGQKFKDMVREGWKK